MATHAINHRIGVMGGSFNPVHCGHLRVARDVKATLKLDRMALMPAAQSPFKGVHSVSAEHRAAMLELAVATHPELDLDLRELSRKGPSYTINSLEALRQGQSPCGGVSRLECSLVNTSSTAIRAAIALGSLVSEVIPDPVIEYITQHKLYAVPSQAEANP